MNFSVKTALILNFKLKSTSPMKNGTRINIACTIFNLPVRHKIFVCYAEYFFNGWINITVKQNELGKSVSRVHGK